MKASIISKLESLKERHEELEALLGSRLSLTIKINSVLIQKNMLN